MVDPANRHREKEQHTAPSHQNEFTIFKTSGPGQVVDFDYWTVLFTFYNREGCPDLTVVASDLVISIPAARS